MNNCAFHRARSILTAGTSRLLKAALVGGVRLRGVVLWAVPLMLFTFVAHAAELSPADTQRAEELGESGVVAYQAGELQQATAKLEEGYRLSGWGTIGVWLAKTYDKLGRTSDAYRVYIEVASSPAVAGEAEPFAQARLQAQQGADAIAATSSIVQLKSTTTKTALSVSVDGKVTPLSPHNSLAVAPGTHTLDVRWRRGKLPRQTLTLVAGQTHVIELDVVKTRERRAAATTPETQYLNFTLAPEVAKGWTLIDGAGKVVCELPCKWSGADPESLVVRQGEHVLPVRLGRKLERQATVDVSVNPKRGSRGWALGLGIPAGVLFGASLVGLANANSNSEVPLIVSTSVFGAGFAACAWWFWWSKSRPYLDYDLPAAGTKQSASSIHVDWLGTGVGVSGSF